MRRKIIIALLALLTILICWTWYENTFAIDWFATKNHHLRNQKRIEIMNEPDIDFVRQKAVKILDNYELGHSKTDKTIIKVQNILTLTACLTFLTLIVAIFEFRRKNDR
jgi:hypothetical protein